MRNIRTGALVVIALLLLGAFIYANAQQLDTTCPILIDQALNAMGTNCSSLDRNSACYGYQQVEATFSEPMQPDYFSQPSDRAGLTTLRRIGTSPLDMAQQQWGIALLSLQANLPDSLPGQNTVFMLLGDTEVENGVKPADLASAGSPVQVTTAADTSLFDYPEMSELGTATIPAAAALAADGVTEDGAWVRVAFGDQPGWVARTALVDSASLDALPVIHPNAQSPMQTFYLRTGITGTHCTQAPDSLIVQGPQHYKVDLTVNGADIRLGSTIALRVLPISPELAALFRSVYPDIDQVTSILELVVIDGHVTLDPGTAQEEDIDAGYRTYRCLSEPENLGLDEMTNDRHVFAACPWLSPDRWRQVDYDYYNVLEGIPLNYPILLPEFPAPTLTPSRTPTRRPTAIPVVATRTPSRTPSPTATPTLTCVLPDADVEIVEGTVFCTATPTNPAPTDTATATATATATSTATATATATSTATSLPPTSTPTSTPTDVPTDTPTNPPPTDTPTNVPTDTPTNPPPTDTPTNVPPTATPTDVPPTATDTQVVIN